MNFFIKKGATLPVLALELIQDGFSTYDKFYEKIQNAVAKFSMTPVDGCVKKVICKEMKIVEDDCFKCQDCAPKYLLVYQWKTQDTNTKGVYKGEVEIDFLDGTGKLIVPIREELFINVI